MFKIFNKHPKKGCVYAITAGKFLGELFVFVEKKSETFMFLSLPTMTIRDVPVDKFELGLKERIIDIVERLPRDIFSICIKQYRKNKMVHK